MLSGIKILLRFSSFGCFGFWGFMFWVSRLPSRDYKPYKPQTNNKHDVFRVIRLPSRIIIFNQRVGTRCTRNKYSRVGTRETRNNNQTRCTRKTIKPIFGSRDFQVAITNHANHKQTLNAMFSGDSTSKSNYNL